jgi:maleate cis-trans isomerase
MRTHKLGCISPSVVNLPWDLQDALRPGIAAMVTTLNVRNGRPGEFERAVATMGASVDVLIDEGAGAIAVFGVPVSARRGFASERDALRALTAPRGAVPIVSTLAAVCEALADAGVRRPLLVTQYADGVNAQIAQFFADAGLATAGAAGLGARDAAAVNATSPDDYAALARRALAAHPSADGVFLSARGNLAPVARDLTRETGLPAVEQVGAAAWWADRTFRSLATV